MTTGHGIWGGRFMSGPDPELIALTTSIGVDMALLEYDLAATKAHAKALGRVGMLTADDVVALGSACDDLAKQPPAPDDADEDVHSYVERCLTERLGELGERIHAGRSRNDLVVTDFRSWCKDAGRSLELLGMEVVDALVGQAEAHRFDVMPGYTHLQRGQPVSLGFHLAAHCFALLRDRARFATAREAADVGCLGAGAVAGSTLGLDSRATASELGFAGVFDNAMDAVADRDFACDLAYAIAMTGVHLSRLAEELVLWTSAEFGFARLPDAWSTGSSMMPQKRNPDVAELARGGAAIGIAELNGLLVLLKGLPLAYDRDLQDDKTLLFAAAARLERSLLSMARLVAGLEFDVERLRAAAGASASWATDLAEALVTRGVPFRQAHAATGALVADLEARGLGLDQVSVEDLKQHHPEFEAADLRFADPVVGMSARSGAGGTAPERVGEQLAAIRSALTAVRSGN